MENCQEKWKLIKYAKENGDTELAFVLGDIESPWDYLLSIFKDSALALPDSKRSIESRIKQNKKRYDQLTTWLRKENTDPYRSYYEAELEILNKYVYQVLIDALEINENGAVEVDQDTPAEEVIEETLKDTEETSGE